MATTLNIIGCGRVGRTLARLWAQNRTFEIRDVLDSTREKSAAAVAFVGNGRTVGALSEMRSADVWMLTPPDDQIVACCTALAAAELLKPGNIVFHCCGALPASDLASAAARGAAVASVHPLKSFADAGSNSITVHAEACPDVPKVVEQIHRLGAKVGVALRPQTGLEALTPCLDRIELALLMTVNPGFGGQAFMPEVLPKIEKLRKVFDRYIQVDGGITQETARATQSAGADVMVAGTSIFSARDAKQAIAALRGQGR